MRLSSAHNNQLADELNSFKQKIQALADENRGLTGQVREGQEKLRLSATNATQLVSQI